MNDTALLDFVQEWGVSLSWDGHAECWRASVTDDQGVTHESRARYTAREALEALARVPSVYAGRLESLLCAEIRRAQDAGLSVNYSHAPPEEVRELDVTRLCVTAGRQGT